MDFTKLMKQAQQMQKNLASIEKELNATEYEGNASSGMVKCTVNGANELLNLDINAELLTADNKEMLQDLVKIAVNDAFKKASSDRETRMNAITAGVKMPGIF